MSSSPVAASSVESAGLTRPGLLELFEQVADPRARRGIRHRFAVLLAVALSAVLAGARSFVAIGEWVADADAGVLVKLGVGLVRRPCEATIRRALARVDAEQLDGVLGAWMRTRVGVLGGRRALRVHRQGQPARSLRPVQGPAWAKIRAASAVDVGHGRRVRRTIKVAAAPVLLDFAGAVQVAPQLRRTCTLVGKKSVEVVYIITSMPSTEASPLQIATWVQGHWGIEVRHEVAL